MDSPTLISTHAMLRGAGVFLKREIRCGKGIIVGRGNRKGIRRKGLDVDLTKEFSLFMKFSAKYNEE